MIYVDITTRCPQRERVLDFAVRVIESFFTHRFQRDAFIDITVGKIQDGYLGFCVGDREQIDIDLSRRGVEDEMLSPKDIARNLAHELVHAKQFIKGQIDGDMRYRKSTAAKWVDHTDTEYLDQPWEQEAYGLEEELVERFWK